MKPFAALLVLFVALTAGAQDVRVGGLEGNGAVFGSSAGTIIDWTRPAAASGTLTTASVAWTDASVPCDNIFYVRFYAIPGNALVTVMTAERGPFRAVNGINTVALEPPVDVTSETYIGVRRVAGPESCGKTYGTFTRTPSRALWTDQDFRGGSLTALSPLNNYRLQAQASSGPSVRVSTILVAGSTAGGFGSMFRTALTLSNPSALEIRGKLVFRPAGVAGNDSNPSLDYVIPPNGTLNYADIIATMGQTGLGSLDVFTTASPTPIASARIFNDAGAEGTSGLSEEAIPAGSTYLSLANVLIPTDLTNFRLNIGIRTIAATNVNIEVYNAAGQRTATRSRSYPANYFIQTGASAFIDNAELPPGGKIVVFAYEKEFYVYGSVTDNRTNDPGMRIGLD